MALRGPPSVDKKTRETWLLAILETQEVHQVAMRTDTETLKIRCPFPNAMMIMVKRIKESGKRLPLQFPPSHFSAPPPNALHIILLAANFFKNSCTFFPSSLLSLSLFFIMKVHTTHSWPFWNFLGQAKYLENYLKIRNLRLSLWHLISFPRTKRCYYLPSSLVGAVSFKERGQYQMLDKSLNPMSRKGPFFFTKVETLNPISV